MTRAAEPSGFLELDRAAWAGLAHEEPLPLDEAEVHRLRGLGDPIDLDEVREAYLPVSRLLSLEVRAAHARRRATDVFLHVTTPAVPFVIGIAGSVAVGKSTTARLLQLLLARRPDHPRVDLVTTDGFLLPNAVLERRGILARKGFPESYDRKALVAFLAALKAGEPYVLAPEYSHLRYDVVEGRGTVIEQPDVLILEGLNVLQPPRLEAGSPDHLAVSDFFDFSLYVDADERDIRRWYVERFLRLRETAFVRPDSYFRRYASLDTEAAVRQAEELWDGINGPNLIENILPTRGRATLVLRKGPDHGVVGARLRRR